MRLTCLRLTRLGLAWLRLAWLRLTRPGLTRLRLARLLLTGLGLARLRLALARPILAGLRVRGGGATPVMPRPGRLRHARREPELSVPGSVSARPGGGIGLITHVPIMARTPGQPPSGHSLVLVRRGQGRLRVDPDRRPGRQRARSVS